MTETHDDHVQEAQRLLASRVADMRVYLAAAENAVDVWDDDEWQFDGEWFSSEASTDALVNLGPLGSYGLAWERVSANFRDETVTYSHQLSTGGPGDEFLVTFEAGTPHAGSSYVEWTVSSVVYVYLPWFDRVEIGPGGGRYAFPDDDTTTATDFYATFYADLIGEENAEVFG